MATRRSGSATTTGSPPWSPHLVARRPAGAAHRRRRPATTRPPSQGASRRVPFVATTDDLGSVTISGDGVLGRHRRHGDQGRGGADRQRGRDPRRAHLGRPTSTPRWPAPTSAPVPATGSGDPDLALLLARPRDRGPGAARPRRRRRRGRSSSAARRCCRPASPGSTGRFAAGDPSTCAPRTARSIARGLVNYDSAELPRLLGRSTRDLARELGPSYEREVVHRDDLVVL